jgi:protein O-GlcNAc transferase
MATCLKLLLAWPDAIDLAALPLHSLERIAALVRLNQLRLAETELLAGTARFEHGSDAHGSALVLLAQIRLMQGALPACGVVLQQLERFKAGWWPLRWLQAQLLLQRGELARLAALPPSYWHDEQQHPLLQIVHAAERLANHDLEQVKWLIGSLPQPAALETLRLQAGLLHATGRSKQAFELLLPLLQRAPQQLLLHAQVFELVLVARQIPHVVPIARQALLSHGEHPELLNNVTAVKLYQRQPGYARRCALVLQTWASLGSHRAGMPNQICAYEQCGHADWLDHLHPAIWRQPLANQELSGNLVLHLASTQSARYAEHLTALVSARARTPQQDALRLASPLLLSPPRKAGSRPLRIAWVSADFTPHPVSRFLQHFFAASQGRRQHQHMVVSLLNHGTHSNLATFEAMADLDVVDVSGMQGPEKVSAIRSLQADVAIDLCGWTGGHFSHGFQARLASVQVNYLGYFASSGLSEMDYWLGDHQLFPDDFGEWHTETLWRLPRPFIAWQPASGLPESQVDVPEGPIGPIRFGSFNNNRKLSDRTLALWGQIVERVPEARLVLKANAGDDQPTQALLARRMRRLGLDPERVEWLPLTPTCEEHLMQYRHVDVALDPVPNGGCTTTLEALWMGCPVITLAGTHYVSRMSTAVMHGAERSDWICLTESAYVDLAVAQARQLDELRKGRERMRLQLISSRLGDASDLIQHLEAAFGSMVN